MRIATAMRVTITGSNGDATHLERCDSERSVDIAAAAPLDIARGGRLEQAVEPEVVIKPDAHNEPRILQPQHILRFWLIFLGAEIGRYQADRIDEVAAYRLGQAAQISRRGNDVNKVLRPRR